MSGRDGLDSAGKPMKVRADLGEDLGGTEAAIAEVLAAGGVRPDLDYFAPWQVALRRAPGAAVCCDPDCDLSGGAAHVGDCEPCTCGKEHAVAECPATRTP